MRTKHITREQQIKMLSETITQLKEEITLNKDDTFKKRLIMLTNELKGLQRGLK